MRAVCSGTGRRGCCGWSDMAKPPEITAPTPLSTFRLTHSPTVSGPTMGQLDRCETVCAMSNDTARTTMPIPQNGTVLPRSVPQARLREYLLYHLRLISSG